MRRFSMLGTRCTASPGRLEQWARGPALRDNAQSDRLQNSRTREQGRCCLSGHRWHLCVQEHSVLAVTVDPFCCPPLWRGSNGRRHSASRIPLQECQGNAVAAPASAVTRAGGGQPSPPVFSQQKEQGGSKEAEKQM